MQIHRHRYYDSHPSSPPPRRHLHPSLRITAKAIGGRRRRPSPSSPISSPTNKNNKNNNDNTLRHLCSASLRLAPPPPASRIMSASEPHLLPDLNSGPRSFITTSQDHAGIALVMCTLLATWAVLCLIVRVYMRATVSGPFGKDDALCSLATVCCVSFFFFCSFTFFLSSFFLFCLLLSRLDFCYDSSFFLVGFHSLVIHSLTPCFVKIFVYITTGVWHSA